MGVLRCRSVLCCRDVGDCPPPFDFVCTEGHLCATAHQDYECETDADCQRLFRGRPVCVRGACAECGADEDCAAAQRCVYWSEHGGACVDLDMGDGG